MNCRKAIISTLVGICTQGGLLELSRKQRNEPSTLTHKLKFIESCPRIQKLKPPRLIPTMLAELPFHYLNYYFRLFQ